MTEQPVVEKDEEPELMTPKEVAQLFRVDPQTVRRWVQNRIMHDYNITVVKTPGMHNRFLRKDVYRVFQELNPLEDIK